MGQAYFHTDFKLKRTVDMPKNTVRDKIPPIRKLLDDNLTVSVPEAGKILGFGRNSSFAAAHAGEIKTLRFGRLLRVPTAWLRRKLELDEPAS
jgi:hypothetical protein